MARIYQPLPHDKARALWDLHQRDMRQKLSRFADGTTVLLKKKDRPFIEAANNIFASEICHDDADLVTLDKKLEFIRAQLSVDYQGEFEDNQAWKNFIAKLESKSVGHEAIASIANDLLKNFLLTLLSLHENATAHYKNCLYIQSFYIRMSRIDDNAWTDKNYALRKFAYWLPALVNANDLSIEQGVASKQCTAMYLYVYMRMQFDF